LWKKNIKEEKRLKTVVVLIDASTSMTFPVCGRSKWGWTAKIADLFEDNDKVAFNIVLFNHKEVYRISRSKLQHVQPSGGTNISNAFQCALDMRPDHILLMSDGDTVEPDTEDAVILMANACQKRGIPVDTFSVWDDKTNDRILALIAEITGGKYIKWNPMDSEKHINNLIANWQDSRCLP
jgi:Mg-chelatase subunit ChlD